MDFPTSWSGSDLVLRVEEKALHVHKQTLSIWSPVFDCMLNSDFVEREAGEITLKGKKYEQIECMLRIMYDRRERVTDITVGFLLSLADEYQMEMLHSECIDHIKQSDSLLKHLNLVVQYNLVDLQTECLHSLQTMSTEQLESRPEFDAIDTQLKYTLCSNRAKLLEKRCERYHTLVDSILRYVYSHASTAFEEYLRGFGLEESVFSRCELQDQHKAVRAGVKFDMNCSLCRKRVQAAKHLEVNIKDLSEILEPLRVLNKESEN